MFLGARSSRSGRYHGDGVSNTTDIVENDRGVVIMMINGNIEADTSLIQRRHFILKASLETHPMTAVALKMG